MKHVSAILAIGVVLACGLLPGCSSQGYDEFMQSARSYLDRRDARAAIVQLKNALDQRPDSSEARLLLGKALLEAGEPVSASVELRKALDLKHAPQQVVPSLARSMLAEGQPRRVIDQFGSTDLGDPLAAADLMTSLAAAYAALGNSARAQEPLDAALKLSPGFNPARLLQARLWAEQRRYAEASAVVDKVLSDAPTNSQAWQQRGDYLLLSRQDTAGAMAAYREALRIDPRQVPARSNLIALLMGQRDFTAAQEQVEELRRTIPNHPQTIFFDAQLAMHKGDPKKALELIKAVVKVDPENAQVLQAAGTIEFANGLFRESERTFGKALSLSPRLPIARRELARTYLRLGDAAKVLETLEPLTSDPKLVDAQTFALAGEAHLLAGELDQARAAFAKSIQKDPTSTRTRTALALADFRSTKSVDAAIAELQSIAAAEKGREAFAELALVSIYLSKKDYQSALKAVDAIETKQPDSPSGPNLRGRVHLLRDDVAEARRSFERALSRDPMFGPAATSLAMLDMADKNPEAAKKRFTAMLAIDPRNMRALMAVAELRAAEGAPKEEIAGLIRKAVKLNPGSELPRLLLVEHHLRHREFPAALQTSQEAVAALPESMELLDALGRSQLAAGDSHQALTTFGKLASKEPLSPRAHMRAVGAHLSLKDRAAAEENLKRALAVTPDLLPAQQAHLKMLLQDQRWSEATALAKSVQRQRPAEPVGYLMESSLDVARKNWPAAVQVLRAVLVKFPYPELAIRLHSALVLAGRPADAESMAAKWLAEFPLDTAFHFYLGEHALLRRDYGTAERHFRIVSELQPTNTAALNNVAWTMVQQHKLGAVAVAERALKLQPNAPNLMDTLASALAADQEIARALELQKKALALSPRDAVLRLNLAKLQIKAGDKRAARDELDTLAKLDKSFSGHSEVSRLLASL